MAWWERARSTWYTAEGVSRLRVPMLMKIVNVTARAISYLTPRSTRQSARARFERIRLVVVVVVVVVCGGPYVSI